MKNYIPLKVEFCLYENILCGKILQQDDRLIKQVNTEGILIGNSTSYCLSILNTAPHLYKYVLYLKGEDKDKNNTFSYQYINKQTAEDALKNFKELIKQVNNFYADRSPTEKINSYFVEVCE